MEAHAEGVGITPKLIDWHKTGNKPGGSNPGGIYTDHAGEKWLVKGNNQGADDNRARNEVLATHLMKAAGIPAPEMKLIDLGDQHGGGLGVAIKWVDGLDTIKSATSGGNAVRDQFAVHAWLANYDVIGPGAPVGAADNIKWNPATQEAVNIDPGGAVLYRAQGKPKTDFGPVASSWDTMRDPKINLRAAAFFKSMTASELSASADKLKSLSDAEITSLVKASGIESADKLASTLIARKNDILKRADRIKNP